MAFIEKIVTEAEFHDEVVAVMVENGWTKEKSFHRLVKVTSEDKDDNVTKASYTAAKHIILKNADDAYYGIAQIWKYESSQSLTMDIDTEEGKEAFKQFMKSNPQYIDRSCMYTYMIEKLPSTADDSIFIIGAEAGQEINRLMDLELAEVIRKERPGNMGSVIVSYEYKDTPELMMSPWVKSTFRNPKLTSVNVDTNWWADSLVRITGHVDKYRVVLLIQADRTPAFDNNSVPNVPVYLGRLESYGEADTIADALWAGSAYDEGAESASHSFDFENKKPFRDVSKCMPRTKSYPKSPGNGIDNVIIKRSRFGARYQAHYISWSTPSNKMPPDRKSTTGGQYPSAWQSHENDEYKYQFNPSMYSNKVHTSRAYIVHPEEGVRGYMPYMVLLSPLGLLNGDKLKVRKNTCPDSHDIYRFFTVDAISPVTKMPSTVYRPAGIGIFEKTV